MLQKKMREKRVIDFSSAAAAVNHKQVSDKNVSLLFGLLCLQCGGREMGGDTSVSSTVNSN